MNKDLGKYTAALMAEHGAALDKLLKTIRENCSQKEFEAYCTVIGKIMGFQLEVMKMVFKEYPELIPSELIKKF